MIARKQPTAEGPRQMLADATGHPVAAECQARSTVNGKPSCGGSRTAPVPLVFLARLHSHGSEAGSPTRPPVARLAAPHHPPNGRARSGLAFSHFNRGAYQAFLDLADQVRRRLTAMAATVRSGCRPSYNPSWFPGCLLWSRKRPRPWFFWRKLYANRLRLGSPQTSTPRFATSTPIDPDQANRAQPHFLRSTACCPSGLWHSM